MRKHTVANAIPIALFIFSGRALSVGRAMAWTPADFAVALGLSLAVLPVAYTSAGAVFCRDGMGSVRGAIGKGLYLLFSAAAIVAALFVAVLGAREFSLFASEVMLLRMPALPVTVIFLGFCGYLASLGDSAVRKFSLVAFALTVLSVILLFLLSVPNFDAENARGLLELDGITASGVISSFGAVLAPSTVAVIYVASCREKRGESRRAAFVAPILAAILLFVCFLNVRLLLGEAFGGTRAYPYSEAVSTVTAGKLFARMEGFAYLMYYGAAAVKAAVSIALACRLIKGLTPTRWQNSPAMRGVPYLLSLAVAVSTAVM